VIFLVQVISLIRTKNTNLCGSKNYVQSLGLKNLDEWRKWSKTDARPHDIPTNPQRTYSSEWKGNGDFLGTGTLANKNIKFRSFKDARVYVRTLNLKNSAEWNNFAKSEAKPLDIPAKPFRTYSKEWMGYGDFLVQAPLQVNVWNLDPSRKRKYMLKI
jgi:hypothetical protein